ncbi:MAG: HAD hydrolase family protein [Planctomycetia bacterium]|nr:HAD hydrolase family protein [Planctomycetia bacterium]
MDLQDRMRPIELVLSDVDGVLTDGGIVFDNEGIEIKRFHIRDGLGIRLWQRAGHRFGLVTGRTSHIVQMRAAELGIDIVRQGFEEKLPAVLDLMRELNLRPHQVCYVGDDLPDLPVVRHVGLGVTVADACPELLAAAHFTTSTRGGEGAVRELLEMILKAQGRWDDLIERYVGA